MSIVTLVLGESGSGKTASLRHFDPTKTLTLACIKKPLSFRAPGWGLFDKESGKGNVLQVTTAPAIIKILKATHSKCIVIDDFQEVMTREFISRSQETGYQKFTDIAVQIYDILDAASNLGDDVRVYILAHTQTDESGFTRIKTVGRMVDEKVVPESRVTICLRTAALGGEYTFRTHTSGSDTVKTPMGLFDQDEIPNDLAAVDLAICDYYGIDSPAILQEPATPAPKPPRAAARKSPAAAAA